MYAEVTPENVRDASMICNDTGRAKANMSHS